MKPTVSRETFGAVEHLVFKAVYAGKDYAIAVPEAGLVGSAVKRTCAMVVRSFQLAAALATCGLREFEQGNPWTEEEEVRFAEAKAAVVVDDPLPDVERLLAA